MYVHKKCAPSGADLDMEKRVGGFCAICNQSGTIYHVKDTADYYEQIVDSVLYKIVDGKQYNTRAAVRQRLREELAEARATRAMDAHNERVPVWEMKTDNETFKRDESIEEAESIPEIIMDSGAVAEMAEQSSMATGIPVENIDIYKVETVEVQSDDIAEDSPQPEEVVSEDTPTDEPEAEELLEITGEPITEEEVEKQREKHIVAVSENVTDSTEAQIKALEAEIAALKEEEAE